MQIKPILVSSILLFSSLAIATQTITITKTEEHTSFTTIETITSTGTPPTGSQAPSILTTTGSPSVSTSAGYYGNSTAPAATSKPASTSTATSGAASGGFSGPIRMAAVVGIAVAMVGSL